MSGVATSQENQTPSVNGAPSVTAPVRTPAREAGTSSLGTFGVSHFSLRQPLDELKIGIDHR